jgi:hypothetical protein
MLAEFVVDASPSFCQKVPVKEINSRPDMNSNGVPSRKCGAYGA